MSRKPIRPTLVLVSLTAILLLCWIAFAYWPRAITESALSAQLDGSHCRFVYDIDHCEQRGLDPLRMVFTEDHDCDLWAVQCLMAFDTPEARQAMIRVLSEKTDIQTCDGVRPVRTYAVRYLGNSADPSAVPPLRKHLESKPRQRLSSGAAGCVPGPEDTTEIQDAIKKLGGG